MWSYDVKDEGTAQTFHGEMVLHDDRLFVAADPVGGHIYSFDPISGERYWLWSAESGVSSDLMVVDNRLIAVTLDNELIALDVTTGELLWTSEGAGEIRGASPTTPSPVVFEGDLIWGRKDGVISRRNVATGEVIWSTLLGSEIGTDLFLHEGALILGLADGGLLRIDPADGERLAETEIGAVPTYRWLPAGKDLIVGMTGIVGNFRRLICLDSRTLDLKWSITAPEDHGWTSSQPTIAWGHILVGTNEPMLYAIDPESGETIWTVEVPKSPRTIKVVDDHIYIGTFGGTLLAYRR